MDEKLNWLKLDSSSDDLTLLLRHRLSCVRNQISSTHISFSLIHPHPRQLALRHTCTPTLVCANAHTHTHTRMQLTRTCTHYLPWWHFLTDFRGCLVTNSDLAPWLVITNVFAQITQVTIAILLHWFMLLRCLNSSWGQYFYIVFFMYHMNYAIVMQTVSMEVL